LKPLKPVAKRGMNGALTLTNRLSKTTMTMMALKKHETLKGTRPLSRQESIHKDTVNMFKRVLLFIQGVAVAHYNNQMITTLDVLQDLTDDIIKKFCRAIRKPGGDIPGHQISELSVTCLKLFAFWARHMWRTSRGVDNWADMTWDDIKTLTNQKILKDSLLDTKQPKTPTSHDP
jgi:hypothetical protein